MTKDHDRKALIRERMDKTGESYTTARRQLFADGDAGPPDDASQGPTFSMPDGTAARASTLAKVEEMYANSGVKVENGALRVWMVSPGPFLPPSRLRRSWARNGCLIASQEHHSAFTAFAVSGS